MFKLMDKKIITILRIKICLSGPMWYVSIGSNKQAFLVLKLFLFSYLSKHIFSCSKEPFHIDNSFEYLQHMFWLRNNKNNF